MKISFSISSKSGSSKPNLIGTSENREAGKDYVSEFDGSKSLGDFGKPDVLIIPPKQNEWMPSMNMRNLHLPLSESVGSDIRFEQESSYASDRSHGSEISYGLNLRNSYDVSASTATNAEDEFESGIGQPRGASVEVVRLQKLKDDLKRLPEDRGFEEFEKIPVEAFGTALLAGYGWREGRGIGKNAKEDTKVVQFMKRTDKQGLGFLRHTLVNLTLFQSDVDQETGGDAESHALLTLNLYQIAESVGHLSDIDFDPAICELF